MFSLRRPARYARDEAYGGSAPDLDPAPTSTGRRVICDPPCPRCTGSGTIGRTATYALIVAAAIPVVEVVRPARRRGAPRTRRGRPAVEAQRAPARAADPADSVRLLADHGHGAGSTVTLADVQQAFGCGDKRARRVMHVLTAQRLAVHHERAAGTPQPHTWTIQ